MGGADACIMGCESGFPVGVGTREISHSDCILEVRPAERNRTRHTVIKSKLHLLSDDPKRSSAHQRLLMPVPYARQPHLNLLDGVRPHAERNEQHHRQPCYPSSARLEIPTDPVTVLDVQP